MASSWVWARRELPACSNALTRRMASMSAGEVTSPCYSGDSASRAPSRRMTRGGSAISELVLRLNPDLAALDRPRQEHAADAARLAEFARVAFRQTDLIGQIRSFDAELPVLAVVGDDAGTQRVIRSQGLQTRDIFIALADMLVSDPTGHVTPSRHQLVAGHEPVLDLRLTLQRRTINDGALFVAEDVDVRRTAIVVSVVTVHIVADHRQVQVLDR